jgi:hypothetical protein
MKIYKEIYRCLRDPNWYLSNAVSCKRVVFNEYRYKNYMRVKKEIIREFKIISVRGMVKDRE